MRDPLIEMAIHLDELKERIEKLKIAQAELQKEYDNLRNFTLPETMASREIPRVTVGKIGKTLYTAPMVDGRIALEASRTDAQQWLKDNGYGDLIVEYVHPSSLRAMIKEQVEQGEEFPEELFTVRMWQQARLRKG